jgi:hypothetical protein
MIALNKLQQELHAAAVEKGFWDVENAESRHIAKMHCELSEAVQEDRCGRPLMYVDDIEMEARITDPEMFAGRKPEGVAAELADFVMMALDYMAHVGVDFSEDAGDVFAECYTDPELCSEVKDSDLCDMVNIFHSAIVEADEDGDISALIGSILMACAWLEIRGCDLWQVIRLKMEYNKSRPALHGRAY